MGAPILPECSGHQLQPPPISIVFFCNLTRGHTILALIVRTLSFLLSMRICLLQCESQLNLDVKGSIPAMQSGPIEFAYFIQLRLVAEAFDASSEKLTVLYAKFVFCDVYTYVPVCLLSL